MAKTASGETLALAVYDELRAAILNGRLAPDERLKSAELGLRLGVSAGVIREALAMLSAHELVRIDRNRAFRVTPLSLEALANLTEVRTINEAAALRLSVTHGGVSWESEVLAAHHRAASQPMYRADAPDVRNDEWAQAHLAFHDALLGACANPRLLEICRRLSDVAELYRAWSGPAGRETGRDVAGEHRALLDAALAHDADLAVALLEAHVRRTQAVLTAFVAAAGDRPGHAAARH